MISLNTSYQSLRSSAQHFNSAASIQGKSLEKIASGKRGPEGSGSGAARELRWRNAAKRTGSLEQGILSGMSFLDSQAATLNRFYNALSRMGELAVKMSDATKSYADPDTGDQPDLNGYMAEFSQLQTELVAALQEKFNGINLMRGYGVKATPLNIYLSADGRQKLSLTQTQLSGANGSTWTALLDRSMFGIQTPADVVDGGWASSLPELLADVAGYMAANATQRERLGLTLDKIQTRRVNDESAISRLSEPDVAREVTVLAKANMQLQSSVAMRTQANVLSDAALKVLMG